MKISFDFPPNIQSIREVFPVLDEWKPVFAYGDTLYNPFKRKILDDTEAHEKAHSDRQGSDPTGWWYKYLTDKVFRLDEEVIGYGEQYKYAKGIIGGGKLLEWKLDKLAEALSSELYGNICSYGEARSKIRNYAKEE